MANKIKLSKQDISDIVNSEDPCQNLRGRLDIGPEAAILGMRIYGNGSKTVEVKYSSTAGVQSAKICLPEKAVLGQAQHLFADMCQEAANNYDQQQLQSRGVTAPRRIETDIRNTAMYLKMRVLL